MVFHILCDDFLCDIGNVIPLKYVIKFASLCKRTSYVMHITIPHKIKNALDPFHTHARVQSHINSDLMLPMYPLGYGKYHQYIVYETKKDIGRTMDLFNNMLGKTISCHFDDNNVFGTCSFDGFRIDRYIVSDKYPSCIIGEITIKKPYIRMQFYTQIWHKLWKIPLQVVPLIELPPSSSPPSNSIFVRLHKRTF